MPGPEPGGKKRKVERDSDDGAKKAKDSQSSAHADSGRLSSLKMLLASKVGPLPVKVQAPPKHKQGGGFKPRQNQGSATQRHQDGNFNRYGAKGHNRNAGTHKQGGWKQGQQKTQSHSNQMQRQDKPYHKEWQTKNQVRGSSRESGMGRVADKHDNKHARNRDYSAQKRPDGQEPVGNKRVRAEEKSVTTSVAKKAKTETHAAQSEQTTNADGTTEQIKVQVAAVAAEKKTETPRVSCNWLALSQQLKEEKKAKKKKETAKASGNKVESKDSLPRGGQSSRPGYILPENAKNMVVEDPIAIDCEMVGVGDDGSKSVLARVSIVDVHCNVLMDSYVAPQEKVTDLRTWVSGIRWQDLKGAPKFNVIQKIVGHLTKDKIIVGHSIKNDLEALMLKHPKQLIRDTAKYKPYMRNRRARKLKDLCKEELGLVIQSGEHSSVEDARAALLLYKQVRPAWEKEFEDAAKRKLKFSKKKVMAKPAAEASSPS